MGHAGFDGLVEFEATGLVEVASGLQFPEGPVALDDGSVLLVEIERGTLSRVLPDGSVEVVADLGGGPNGTAFGPDGRVYVCNNGGFFDYERSSGIAIPHPDSATWEKGSIQRVDPATGGSEVLYRDCNGQPLLAPNDLVFDRHGGFWFTDHGVRSGDAAAGPAGAPSVLYSTVDGSSIVGVLWGLDATNGIGLSPDGTTLYVAETYTGRLFSFDVTGPGEVAGSTIADGRLLYDADGSALFDSLAVASDGSVCVATLLTGGITVVPADGGVPTFLSTGDPLTTNICFGGSDGRTAFITCSGTGRLLRCTWPVAGADLAHRG